MRSSLGAAARHRKYRQRGWRCRSRSGRSLSARTIINRKGKEATMRTVSGLSFVTLGVSLLILALSAGLAAGKTLYVKKSGKDTASCTATDPCTLISHAVTVAAAGDTISVGAGTFLETDSIRIKKDITIAGGWWLGTRVSLLIDPNQASRTVFEIESGAKVKLTGLTISGGNGGGINNLKGNLTLTNVWITNNTGEFGISNVSGGSLFMTNVGIDHNSGTAGLTNHGTALVIDSHIQGTYSPPGSSGGRGVLNSGTLLMNRGLIAGNDGSGLLQGSTSPPECPATAYLVNVTISGNHATGIQADCGQLLLRHVTIAANTAESGPGGLQVDHTVPVVENSIIATNSGNQCGFFGGPGTVVSISVSYSLVGDNSCLAWPRSNLVGVDPKLSALAYPAGEDPLSKLFHIGADRVQALLPGSPAIDRGGDKFCTGPIAIYGEGWATDQLGVQRPIDGDGDGAAHCDMGAYEYRPPK
jgi:hypothetical protein